MLLTKLQHLLSFKYLINFRAFEYSHLLAALVAAPQVEPQLLLKIDPEPVLLSWVAAQVRSVLIPSFKSSCLLI